MHSILIIGDVRTHTIKLPSGKEDPSKENASKETSTTSGIDSAIVFGGAFLMKAAIERSFIDIYGSKRVIKGPQLYSFIDQIATTNRYFGSVLKEWELAKNPLPTFSIAEDSLRLKYIRKQTFDNTYPPLDSNLLRALAQPDMSNIGMTNIVLSSSSQNASVCCPPPGYFDLPSLHEELPWCPDIIVIDDLGESLFRNAFINTMYDVSNPNIIGMIQNTSVAKEDCKINYERAIDVLGWRIRKASSHLKQYGHKCLLEPVIIASIAGKLPNLKTVISKEINLWQCIYAEPQLRERTIVLLDVEDLRDHEQLEISTGLSWERTAQQTIVAMRRSPQLQRFLEFGQVIVRFGVTGALQISRIATGWNYRLYFDPKRDDRTGFDPDQNNHMLGHTAIFTASLVQSLTRWCSNIREGKPLLFDLPDAVRSALPTAIQRCQTQLKTGYGDPSTPNRVLDIFSNIMIQKELFSLYRSIPAIFEAEIPELNLQNWSILNQSSQNRVGPLARRIVRWGVDRTFNSRVPSQDDIRSAVFDICLKKQSTIVDLWLMVKCEESDFKNALTKSGGLFEEIRALILNAHTQIPELLQEAWLKPVNELGNWECIADCLIAFCKSLSVDISSANEPIIIPSICQQILEESILEHKLNEQPSYLDTNLLDQIRSQNTVTPILNLGERRYILDRREIEGIRRVEKHIESYLKKITDRPHDKHRPLSFAVFGPPGAGKSSIVQSILDKINDPRVTNISTCNLSQLNDSSLLQSTFAEVTHANAQHKIAVAFFDEFDSRYGNDGEWGWLKYFLSPMEDMVFGTEPVHNSIFVFAGGTSPTFADFTLASRNPTDPQIQKFGAAKGPDFVSRLTDFLDVIGINPAEPDDNLYLLRRAVIIRNLIEQTHGIQSNEEAFFDRDIMRAILFVPKYKDGARSLRRMIELCSRDRIKRVSNSSIPPIQQLDMLTDGKAFLDLMANISFDLP